MLATFFYTSNTVLPFLPHNRPLRLLTPCSCPCHSRGQAGQDCLQQQPQGKPIHEAPFAPWGVRAGFRKILSVSTPDPTFSHFHTSVHVLDHEAAADAPQHLGLQHAPRRPTGVRHHQRQGMTLPSQLRQRSSAPDFKCHCASIHISHIWPRLDAGLLWLND